ncbi:hypothetical protein [Streptacidiphilus jiangxiensis]|uniref:Uncharacterized protein n=1 Tax=Streptacidiphilus jiangxiensis TaxID=235985 RepID=A0A1H8BC52_STRJI|nr:hypothetical protein [Streptacidiphilus jiangxiensis]SEM79578.1 hypothetical protein SAMN05414137_1603 [Streptacidiphilus jiangxiensis]
MHSDADAEKALTFEQWGERLNAIYLRGDGDGWTSEVKTEWDQAWQLMSASHPLVSLTWLDPKCGCCQLSYPAVLAFDDPRGPQMFELLYPTFKPTQVYQLG